MDFLKEIFSAGGIYALFLLIFFIFGIVKANLHILILDFLESYPALDDFLDVNRLKIFVASLPIAFIISFFVNSTIAWWLTLYAFCILLAPLYFLYFKIMDSFDFWGEGLPENRFVDFMKLILLLPMLAIYGFTPLIIIPYNYVRFIHWLFDIIH